MRRYLALFFPRWPVQQLRRASPETQETPVALFERTQRGSHLVVCSGDANTLGIRSGMSVADAKALAPQVALHEFNPIECRNALEALCLWATRYSPLAALEEPGPQAPFPQTLMLDITGCEDVFGGEERLIERAVSGVKALGCKVRAAIASTLGAAWAFAHYGPLTFIAPHKPEALKTALASVPLAGLRLPLEVLADFRPLGLNRIGDILLQSRASLPSRFGKVLTERLDQALGVAHEPLVPLRAAPEFRVARLFEYPVRSSEVLFKILEQLVERLARDLKRAQRGACQVECWLYHELATPACADVAFHRSTHSRKHIWQLLRARLEDLFRVPVGKSKSLRRKSRLTDARHGLSIEVDESIEAVALHVTASESVSDQQLPLFDRTNETTSDELSLLLDRLTTRLGPAAVCRVQRQDDPLPERAFRMLTLKEHSNAKKSEATLTSAPRPLQLLPQPESVDVDWPHTLTCARGHYAIRSTCGPERLESGWWRENDQRRDYYIVGLDSGARYWLFKDLVEQRWFLHGSFE